MNQQEAANLREVARTLRQGPNDGWGPFLAGRGYSREPYTPTAEEQKRLDTLNLWMNSWILAPLDRISSRYAKKKKEEDPTP